jgi:UV DNA damage endonuclease
LDSLADTYPSSNARNSLPKNERIKEALQDDNFIPEVVENPGQVNVAAARPPPVNSDYLPLPWKGRLGYVGE